MIIVAQTTHATQSIAGAMATTGRYFDLAKTIQQRYIYVISPISNHTRT